MVDSIVVMADPPGHWENQPTGFVQPAVWGSVVSVGRKATPPWETGRRDTFRVRFGEDPEAYDRTRPVAPDSVFDDIVRLARLHAESTVVEIGPGTGQATRPLAERGLRVLALEIDPRLAARAAQNLAGLAHVSVSATSFEAWDPSDARFDAVFACNSFHWIDPDTRFAKVVEVLEPHGHLVLVSTPVVVPENASRFWWDVQDDWAAVGADYVDPATKHPDLVEDLRSAVRASGLFEDPTVTRHRFDVSLTAEEYVANLSTQSGVKELPPEAQAGLLERIERRVDAHGGTLTVHHVAVVTVTRRAE
ncbi:MAG: class I SAM-dependent methyltransferase [Acidimicrobiales bacterium]